MHVTCSRGIRWVWPTADGIDEPCLYLISLDKLCDTGTWWNNGGPWRGNYNEEKHFIKEPAAYCTRPATLTNHAVRIVPLSQLQRILKAGDALKRNQARREELLDHLDSVGRLDSPQ